MSMGLRYNTHCGHVIRYDMIEEFNVD